MYSKISNTATKGEMEDWMGATCLYPSLYQTQILINGLNEETIPIITNKEPNLISLSIWGLLPEEYEEDWELFQYIKNTLNIHINSIDENLWYTDAAKNRRCLVPVTGFFSFNVKNGQVFPSFIHDKSGKPFYLGGIYNRPKDGFITCAIFTGSVNVELGNNQNMVDYFPIIIAKEDKDTWLQMATDPTKIRVL